LNKPKWSQEGAYEKFKDNNKEKGISYETDTYIFYSDGSFEAKPQ